MLTSKLPPTERQMRVLRLVGEAAASGRPPPTLREIGDVLSIRSTNGVNDHIRALERKGLLMRLDTISRGLVLTSAGRKWLGMEPVSVPPAQETQEAVLVRDALGLPHMASTEAVLDELQTLSELRRVFDQRRAVS